jgi:diacylglycerol O-acyltransferase
MDHLATLDAGFLQAEDSDPHISLAIGGLSVLEGPMPKFDELATALMDRMAKVPRLRHVLRTHRLDMGPPEWEEKPDLDLSHHVRHVALPSPGDDAELYRLTADIMERRLDRAHPLWECWIIEGLAHDRWALLVKLHHCIADGIAAARMIAGLTDDGHTVDSFATELTDARGAGLSFAPPRVSLNPLDWVRTFREISTTTTTMTAQVVKGAVSVLSGLLQPADQTSLTGSVTTMRRYRAARACLSDMHKVCDVFGVTLNDVALAAITHGYREVLLNRGEKPTRSALRTLVPVSVRGNDAVDITDNRVSLMLPLLPVDRANPLDQLRIVHQRMTKLKGSGQRQAGSTAMGAIGALPFPLTAWTVRTLTRLPQRGVVALATNVPGPRHRIQVLGRDVVRMYPIPPIALQLRTGIAMLSYDDDLTFGIVADYDSAPDLDVLADGIEQGVARLVELAERRHVRGGFTAKNA